MRDRMLRWASQPLWVFIVLLSVSAALGGLRIGPRDVTAAGWEALTQIALNATVVVPTVTVSIAVAVVRRRRGLAPAFLLTAVLIGAAIGSVFRIAVIPWSGREVDAASVLLLALASVLWPLVGGVIALAVAHLAEQAATQRALVARTAQSAVERDAAWKEQVSSNLHGRVQGILLVLAERLRTAPADEQTSLEVAQYLDELREGEIRRMAHEMNPAMAQFSFEASLRSLIAGPAQTRAVTLTCPDRLDVLLDEARVSGLARFVLLQAVQEGLNNAMRWSDGDAIWVTVLMRPSSLEIEVRDSGLALDAGAVPGMGSRSLDVWMLSVDGSWSLGREDGTVFRVNIPLIAAGNSDDDPGISPAERRPDSSTIS
jgi:glucose-6-phosphate-specific signal transduction histidine kinase